MSEKNRYLVAYDVSDDARLRKVHRVLRNFGDALQYSVFCCDLSPRERTLFETEVFQVMNLAQDRLLVADLGPVAGRAEAAIATFGAAQLPGERRAIVV